MITLYGRGQSRSFRALWALSEADIEFEYVEVDAQLAASDTYGAINPQRKVPSLTHGTLVLNESAAMVNYAGAIATTELIPTDTAARARYDEICYFVMSDFEQPLWTIGKHRFALPQEQRQASIISTANWEYEKSQQALQRLLDGADYAVGQHFSFADLMIAHTVNWAERFEMPVSEQLVRYRDRHYARPACVASLALLE